MVMSATAALDVAKGLIGESQAARRELDEVDRFLAFDNPVDVVARKAHVSPSHEKNALARFSHTPLLQLVVSEVAQQMVLEGIDAGADDVSAAMWRPFEVNGLVSRQYALWHATVGYGEAHVMVLPGDTVYPDEPGRAKAWMSAFSPRALFASWNDPVEDAFPAFALRTIGQPGKKSVYRLYDDEAVYFLAQDDTANSGLSFIQAREHNMGVCPVVSFQNDMDLEGRRPGDVEKFKIPAQRHDKTVYDRMLAQHYNSWKVRTATGLEAPNSDEDAAAQKFKLAHDDILTGEGDVKFGTLPETQLTGFIQAADADRDMLAAVSQTPVWALNGGQLVNLSADALVEARSMQRLKVGQKQRANGRSIAKAARLASFAEGRYEDAENFNVTARWADVESRSLAQVADALGKIVTMLGVPPALVLDMIPGVTPAKAEEWREFMRANPSETERLSATLNRQLTYGTNV